MVYLALDTGTTNTTVWLMNDGRILHKVKHQVGIRNNSINGDRSLLKETLRETFLSLSRHAPTPPRCVLAAGMLTSSLGFLEVPHVLAPADVEKLSEHVRMKRFPGVSSLPFFLVPGVRIRPAPCDLTTVARTDIIRGEETEIAGLLVSRLRWNRGKPWLFLHLGSHSKAIEVDARGRIVRSGSTLAGESLYVLRTQTILANRLAHLKSPGLQERFFQSGARLGKRYGLLRALFMVRLLEENPAYHQAQLYSFLLGSLLASDLQAFQSLGFLKSGRVRIVLSGQPDLQLAWRTILQGKGYDIETVSPRERVQAFLAGLRQIVFASSPYREFQEGLTART